MGMMARMRSLAPWFIITVGGLFVLFMVISDSNVADMIGRNNNNLVGKIDGDDITYQQFANYVDNYAKQLEQQQGFKLDEANMPYVRDQVWESLITEKLMEKKIKELGIVVTDQEIRDLILGPNPPEFLKRQFTDSLGNFNRSMYEKALMDPRNKELMVQVEQSFKQQKLQEKLQSYITSAVNVTDKEVKTDFIRNNTVMAMDYVKVNPYGISDSEVKVSDSDLQSYYEKKKADYKVEPTRKIKYVFFDKSPSKQDTLQIRDNLASIKTKLVADPASFKTYVESYSDVPYKKDTLDVTSLSDNARDELVKSVDGSIVGPVITNEGYALFKVETKISSNKPQVKAAHILIKGTDENAKKQADELYAQLKGGYDFAKLAMEKSQDGSAANGGNLGWFKEKMMVDEFWNACLAAKVGTPTAPVKTQFGYHIIKVLDRTNSQFVVERIVNKIEVSGNTIERISEKANDFAYLADKDGFEKTAKDFGFKVIESMPFVEESKVVPGLGYNDAIVKFAFDNSVGSISPVYNVSRGYAVVTVVEEKGEGYRPFAEVKDMIKNQVLLEKKIEKAYSIAKQIKSKVDATGNFEDAKTISPLAVSGVAADFNGNGSINGIGREFSVTEKAMKIDLNKISDPIKGTQGAYIIRVTSRTGYDETKFAVQKMEVKQRLLMQKKNMFFNGWLMNAKKEMDITDNRHNFYR